MRSEPNIGAVLRPGDASGTPAVWLIDRNRTPICEVPQGDARGLVFELGELLGLFVCDRGAVSEAAE
ncbi:hypothetical protein AB0I68_05795 [Streptomyces sp. NPDC050448]|uniref:hypothetical protein n=1 Tax=Streptomyces sp. NPDC050448 TaxID=3155404 RepID=UPI0034241B37